MPIETLIVPEDDMTIRIVTGEIYHNEIIETVRSYYKTNTPTKLFLWDMSECSFFIETVNEIRNVLDTIEGFGGYIEGEKTALVAPRGRNLQIIESLELVNLMDKHPFNIRAFHSKEEARQWLLEGKE